MNANLYCNLLVMLTASVNRVGKLTILVVVQEGFLEFTVITITVTLYTPDAKHSGKSKGLRVHIDHQVKRCFAGYN